MWEEGSPNPKIVPQLGESVKAFLKRNQERPIIRNGENRLVYKNCKVEKFSVKAFYSFPIRGRRPSQGSS